MIAWLQLTNFVELRLTWPSENDTFSTMPSIKIPSPTRDRSMVVCSNVVVCMRVSDVSVFSNTWKSATSSRTISLIFSPFERNRFVTFEPPFKLRMSACTKAPPLPERTCCVFKTSNTLPSSSMSTPFFKSLPWMDACRLAMVSHTQSFWKKGVMRVIPVARDSKEWARVVRRSPLEMAGLPTTWNSRRSMVCMI